MNRSRRYRIERGWVRVMPRVATLLFFSLSFANAQSAPHAAPEAQSPATENKAVQDANQPQASQDAAGKTQAPEKKQRRGSLVIAPIPISSPALGTGIIPVVGYIFPISKNDKISPPSVVAGAGLITDNGSRAFALSGQLFLKQDTYRASAVFFQGNLNYNLYGRGVAAGDADVKLPLKQDGTAFFGEILRHIGWKFFVGPRFITGRSVVTIRGGGNSIAPPPDTGLETKLTSLGLSANRDTRPNRFYPATGTLFHFTADFFADALGSRYSFQSYRMEFDKYGSLSPKQVLAYNAYFCATGGDPPFYGNCIYGTRNELRGYEAGRYLDRYMVATQLEYRLALPKRFGVVAFAGAGGVAPGGHEFFRSDSLLPAGGGGLRFLLSKAYHVNLRADIAAGKNEHTFSMGIGEAF